jgi:hypothetical protein
LAGKWFRIDQLDEKSETYPDQQSTHDIPPDHCSQVTTFSTKFSRKMHFGIENSNFIVSDLGFGADEKQLPDGTIWAKFLDSQLFPHVRTNFKSVKRKAKKGELVVTKRQAKWFLDHSDLRLEIKDELILKFFHGVFSLKSGASHLPMTMRESILC